MTDYMNFDEVLDALQVDAAELKKMIKEGQLSAFKDGSEVKFRSTDVDAVRKGLETEPTIILPTDEVDLADEVEAEVEEVDFGASDDDIEISVADSADLQMDEVPTIDMTDDSQNVTEDIEFETEGDFAFGEDDTVVTQEMGAEDTFVEEDEDEDEDPGERTEALRFTDEIADDDDDFEDDEPAQKGGGRRRSRRGGEEVAEQTPIGIMILLIVTFLVMTFQVFVWVDNIRAARNSDVAYDVKTQSENPFDGINRTQVKYQVPTGTVPDMGKWFAQKMGWDLGYPQTFPDPKYDPNVDTSAVESNDAPPVDNGGSFDNGGGSFDNSGTGDDMGSDDMGSDDMGSDDMGGDDFGGDDAGDDTGGDDFGDDGGE